MYMSWPQVNKKGVFGCYMIGGSTITEYIVHLVRRGRDGQKILIDWDKAIGKDGRLLGVP